MLGHDTRQQAESRWPATNPPRHLSAPAALSVSNWNKIRRRVAPAARIAIFLLAPVARREADWPVGATDEQHEADGANTRSGRTKYAMASSTEQRSLPPLRFGRVAETLGERVHFQAPADRHAGLSRPSTPRLLPTIFSFSSLSEAITSQGMGDQNVVGRIPITV